MSDYTRVVFSAMEQGEADFKQTYSSLVNEVSTLETQLQGNLSEWIGSAQQAYHEGRRPSGTPPWRTCSRCCRSSAW